MVDRAKLQERLMATFVDELAEHVESINTGVLELESATDDAVRAETMAKLFRAAHSLKGASRAVDIPPIEHICHKLEDVFTAVRDEKLSLTQNVASVIFSVADAIGSAGERMRQRQAVTDADFAELVDRLEGLQSNDEIPAAAEIVETPAAPTAADLPSAPVQESVVVPEKRPQSEGQQQAPKAPTDVPPFEPSTDERQDTPVPRRLSGATVRVAEEKLDSLMAQAGELLVSRQRLEIRPEDVESLTTAMANCRNDYQSIERSLMYVLESLTVSPAGDYRSDFSNVTSGTATATPFSLPRGTTAARLFQIVGQTGSRLRQMEQQLEDLHRHLLADVRQLNHTGEALQQDIHRIRMLPFSDGCAGLDRAVRDVATATHKQVHLTIEGGDIEVDRTVLEGLRDPLLHLIRNAVDHGIELPAERLAAGKPEAGQLKITTSLKGSQVEITITDDGRGLDRAAILRKLRDKGLPEPLDDQELIRSIFLPGFSTAQMITDVSGRGVGMDVVKSQLEKLHGTIDLSSQPELGSRFSLCVPLTLTTISALFVRSNDNVYGLPNTNVSRLVRFRSDELRSMGGQTVLPNKSTPIPVTTLAAALGVSGDLAPVDDDFLQAVILTTGNRELAVIVDELLGERDAVVKSLGPQIRNVRHVSGATLLRTGDIALLLNVSTLVHSGKSLSRFEHTDRSGKSTSAAKKNHILVVDDSITTRSLLRNILEAAGYRVTPAVDGQDAWTRIQSGGFDLVVSDVDMPNLDGFALTEKIRKSDASAELPVILVTSRDSEEDKAQGVKVGADAYLVKSTFEQSNVLDVIEQLL